MTCTLHIQGGRQWWSNWKSPWESLLFKTRLDRFHDIRRATDASSTSSNCFSRIAAYLVWSIYLKLGYGFSCIWSQYVLYLRDFVFFCDFFLGSWSRVHQIYVGGPLPYTSSFPFKLKHINGWDRSLPLRKLNYKVVWDIMSSWYVLGGWYTDPKPICFSFF
jgi:hypothetical protein